MANGPDTKTADEVVFRQQKVEAFLADPDIQDAFEMADAMFVEEWRNATNPVEREAAWGKQAGLAEVRRILSMFVDEGHFVREQVKRKEKRL